MTEQQAPSTPSRSCLYPVALQSQLLDDANPFNDPADLTAQSAEPFCLETIDESAELDGKAFSLEPVAEVPTIHRTSHSIGSKRRRLSYDCDVCGTSYSEKRTLVRHLRSTTHGRNAQMDNPEEVVRRYWCMEPGCGRDFVRDDARKRHENEKHRGLKRSATVRSSRRSKDSKDSNEDEDVSDAHVAPVTAPTVVIDFTGNTNPYHRHRRLDGANADPQLAAPSSVFSTAPAPSRDDGRGSGPMTALSNRNHQGCVEVSSASDVNYEWNWRTHDHHEDFPAAFIVNATCCLDTATDDAPWSGLGPQLPLNTGRPSIGDNGQQKPCFPLARSQSLQKSKSSMDESHDASSMDLTPTNSAEVTSLSSMSASMSDRSVSIGGSMQTGRPFEDSVTTSKLSRFPTLSLPFRHKPSSLKAKASRPSDHSRPQRPCPVCGKPPGDTKADAREHVLSHMALLEGEHVCEECQMGFKLPADLKHHRASAEHGHCGFGFDHESEPCTGHHPKGEFDDLVRDDTRDQLRLRLLEWQGAQLRSLIQVDNEWNENIDNGAGISRAQSFASRWSIGGRKLSMRSIMSNAVSLAMHSEPDYNSYAINGRPSRPTRFAAGLVRRVAGVSAQSLLTSKSVPNMRCQTSPQYRCESPIIRALRSLEAAERLREWQQQGLDIDWECGTHGTALHLAVSGEEGWIPILLDAGADLQANLLCALNRAEWKISKALIRHGADPDIKKHAVNNPSQCSGNFYERTVIESLLIIGQRALMDAIWASWHDHVGLLLDCGVDPKQEWPWNVCAFHLAVWNGDLKTVKTMLQRGVDPNPRASHRESALGTAVKCGTRAMITLLLEHGASPNLKGSREPQPLHIALEYGRSDIADLLIENGARPDHCKIPSS
jgi:hypothetical protein